MCGICGILGLGPQRVLSPDLHAMRETLRPRGPDGFGEFVSEDRVVGLGHQRLSIVGGADGRQPMSAGEGRVHFVVNGEFYNFRALREELQGKGHVFASESDSEVLGAAYLTWGDDAVARLEGMFALALWDAREKRLLLARDRMGQKPLYYCRREGMFLFGSELKSLMAHPVCSREICTQALSLYLAFENVPEEYCLLEGAAKVQPGELVVVDQASGALEQRVYWDARKVFLSSSERFRTADEKQCEAELEAALVRSVKDRLLSDVPLGVFLSGGIDSSLIAAAATKLLGRDVLQTFAIAFEDPSFDEGPFAKQVAEHLGTVHRERVLSEKELLDTVPRVFDFMCEPLGDASLLPTHLLARFAKEHVKTVLGGDGGDELFLGYPTFQAERVARNIGAGSWLGAGLGRGLRRAASLLPVSRTNFSLDFKAKRFASGLQFPTALRHLVWLSSFSPEDVAVLLGDNARALDVPNLLQRYERRPSDSRTDFGALTLQYARTYLGSGVLTKVDRASMAAGLEVRAPFLDHRLVELVAGMPTRLKLRGFNTKYLLRRLARSKLPQAIVKRPKKGFGAPIADWLRGPLKELAGDMLSPDRLRDAGELHVPTVERLWREHQTGSADHRKPLYTLLSFEMWKANFLARPARVAGGPHSS